MSHWGRNRTLFFTVTDADGLHPKDFAKRWDSWKTHRADWLKGYVKVLEPQRRGRPHYHNLAAVDFDTQPDSFDWDAFTKACDAYKAKDWVTFKAARSRYVSSAAPELRQLWKETRAQMEAYGLGRAELLPVRKEGAISEYIGKYLEKGATLKPEDWKGVRRVELDRISSREWRKSTASFSWVSPGAMTWRHRVSCLAHALGLPQDGDLSAITAAFARLWSEDPNIPLPPSKVRWAYRLRGAMVTGDQKEFTTLCQSIAAMVNGREVGIEYDNGENAAW